MCGRQKTPCGIIDTECTSSAKEVIFNSFTCLFTLDCSINNQNPISLVPLRIRLLSKTTIFVARYWICWSLTFYLLLQLAFDLAFHLFISKILQNCLFLPYFALFQLKMSASTASRACNFFQVWHCGQQVCNFSLTGLEIAIFLICG